MDLTQPPLLYVLIAAAVVVVALLVWGAVTAARKRREQQRLREHYGPEYDRTLERHRSTKSAVADLREREEQHETLELRDLNDADRALVRRHMASAQYRFVEDPAGAVLSAERVVTEVLRAKGYPVAQGPEQTARLVSVDHPAAADTARSALGGSDTNEIGELRRRFINARKTVQEVAGTAFVLDDAAAHVDSGEPTDLRVERHTAPADAPRASTP